MRNKIIFIFLVLLFSLFACGKKVTSNKKYELTGKINFLTINNKKYNKGIVGYIKLFKSISSIDSLNLFKKDYPFVGSSIDPILSMDYRTLGAPAYETETNDNGEFTIKNILNDKYLLVYSSPDFGWHIESLTINSDKNISLNMKEKRYLSQTIDENLEIGPDEFVELSSDTAILSNCNLTIKENTVITLNGCTISVIGSLNIEGNENKPVIFTSSQQTPSRGDWDKIYFTNNSESHIQNAIFSWATNPLNFFSNSVIENIIITNSNYYALHVETSSIEASNITFYHNLNGCSFTSQTNSNLQSTINKSLFLNNSDTSIYMQTDSPIIKNSIFQNGSIQLNVYWDSFPQITHCLFSNWQDYAIISSKRYNDNNSMKVNYCNFKNNLLFFLFKKGSNSIFSNNNFLTDNSIVFELEYYYGGTTINAQRNYWTKTSESEIDDLIIDGNDNEDTNNPGIVDYSNWKNSKISGTGPINN